MTQGATGAFQAQERGVLPCLGNLSFDAGAYRFCLDGQPLRLTLREFELLRLLFDQPDRVIPYEVLTAALWPQPARRSVRHLNVIVHSLRRKLALSAPYAIETVRGRGYGLLRGRGDGSRPAA